MEREERIKSIVSDLIHYAPKVAGFQIISDRFVDIYANAEVVDIDKNLYRNPITQEVVEVDNDFCGTFVERLDIVDSEDKIQSVLSFSYNGDLYYTSVNKDCSTQYEIIKFLNISEAHPSFEVNKNSYHYTDTIGVLSENRENDLARVFIEQVCERLIGGHGIYKALCLKDNEFKTICESMKSVVKEDNEGLKTIDIGFCRIFDRDSDKLTEIISC